VINEEIVNITQLSFYSTDKKKGSHWINRTVLMHERTYEDWDWTER
jgi:hypothetical protein